MSAVESQEFKDHFLGYNIRDCVVQNRSTFYFVIEKHSGQEDQSEYADKRIVKVELDTDGVPTIKHVEMRGFVFVVQSDIKFPEERIAVFDGDGNGFVAGSGIEKPIEPYHSGGLCRGAVVRVKSIGESLLVCTPARDLLIRTGKEQWERVGPELNSDLQELEGFDDFDAYSMKDLYAVGGENDVFHYDGEQWEKIEFPGKGGPSAVCCAGDGFVYIGLGAGTVYRGRNDQWELIHKDKMSIPFQDMVWCDNKVWCTSDWGIWTIEDGKFSENPVKSAIKVCSGHLATRDDVLLVGGFGGAAYFKDGQWHQLFLETELREQSL